MKQIDLVYILGTGSAWNNNELRISLRSVEKNLTGVGKIFVIGENPGFLSEKVIHIYHPDEIGPENADGNMALKIMRACQEKALTDDFLFMNDDFIINQPMHAPDVPYLHKGDMKNHPPGFWVTQPYRFRLRRTLDTLAMYALPTLQYDYHAPMRMNKHRFPEVMQQFNFRFGIGLTFRSLYGNTLAIPAIPVDGQKITVYKSYTLAQLNQRLITPFVGFNDLGLNPSFKFWMLSNFPETSSYEKQPITGDKIADMVHWINSGKKYSIGVQIFRNHYKSRHLNRLFSEYATPVLESKLNFKLNQYINQL